MHYAHNEDAFTHGMGGYFSPQAYFLANVPFTWAGHYVTRWHYNIVAAWACRHSRKIRRLCARWSPRLAVTRIPDLNDSWWRNLQ